MRKLKKLNSSNNSIEMFSVCPGWIQCRPEIDGRSEVSRQTNPNWANGYTQPTTPGNWGAHPYPPKTK